MKLHLLFATCLTLSGILAARPALGQPDEVINRREFHLRSGSKPEWDEFANRTPDGTSLVLKFNSQTNSSEATLLITQDNVKLDWVVQVNGKKVGTLFLMEAPLVHALALPAGALHEGENELSIVPPKENDDILIGEVRLFLQRKNEVLNQAALEVWVTDADNGKPLPCRITLVDDHGRLAASTAVPSVKLALRPGVVYTSDGHARLGVLPGTYTVYATRGFEYGLAQAHVTVAAGQTTTVQLKLKREVPTQGLISSDTHVHTGTYARHGDATVNERAVTLAGEGIELPISTEHDCLVDLSGAAYRTGVQDWLTPVIGDEVTTLKGHFNIFPVNIMAPLPDKRETEWPRLMQQFRSTPGVQIVILNHPRNIHSDFQPFAATNFNAATGRNLREFDFNFDAIEVANSSALQSDWMINFYDWFALLNYGYRFTAVGSSDVHDVSRYIVGQGRTYIQCPDAHPEHLDVSHSCRSLKEGRALVSLGLLADIKVNDRYGVGDLATALGDSLHVSVRVLGPSWVHADRIELFANGVRIREEKLGSAHGSGPLDLEVAWDIPRPRQDVYLVALASGPGVRELYWAIARPYQPSSPHWDPRVVGATNPVWIDADGDGKFTPARGYAQRILDDTGGDPAKVLEALARFDQTVAVETAGVCEERRIDVNAGVWKELIEHAPEPVRASFTAAATGRLTRSADRY